MLARTIVISIGLSLLLTPPLLAQCRILESKDPAAAEIISTAGVFLEKLAREDFQGAKELCAGPQDQLELLDIYARWMAVSQQLSQAAESRFPPQKELNIFRLPLAAVYLRLQSLSSCYVAILDDRASISGSGLFTDPGLCLRRINNRWRVTHLVASEQRTVPLKGTLTAMIDCFESTAKQLQSGKLTSAKDALEEFAKQFFPASDKWIDGGPWRRSATTLPTQPLPTVTPIEADLIAILGQERRSDPVTKLIAAIPALPYMDHSKSALFLYSREAGFTLHFRREDNRLFYVRLCAAGAYGYNQYPGHLPHGLSFADTRHDVERKLGRPAESLGDSHLSYSAYYTRLGLDIDYVRAAPRDPGNPIASITLSLTNPEDHSPVPPTGPAFAMRLIADKPDPSAEILPDCDDPTGRATIAVLPEVLLDASSIDAISPFPKRNPGEFSIDFRMTPEGARRMHQVSTQYIGRRLAIIADGHIIMAPTIRGPLSNSIEITQQPGEKGDFYRLARRIHAAVFALPPRPTTHQSGQLPQTTP